MASREIITGSGRPPIVPFILAPPNYTRPLIVVIEYLRDEEKIPEEPEVAQFVASSKDHAKAIVEAALDQHNPSELCRATVEMLVSILGGEAGNLALKVLATGGLYVAGGAATHLSSLLQQPEFIHAFTRKGRFKDVMERIPVHLITARAALIGAASYGLESLKNHNG
jgi:glucokinase